MLSLCGRSPRISQYCPRIQENGGNGLDWEKGVPHRNGANTFTFNGTTNRDRFQVSINQKKTIIGQTLYPNLDELSMDHVAAFILRPISSTKTMIDCRIFFSPRRSG